MDTIILCIGEESLDRAKDSFVKKLDKDISFEYIDSEKPIDTTEVCKSISERNLKVILFASFIQQQESSCLLQLAEKLHEENIECHAITILPFPFEGIKRKELVLKTNEQLKQYCASVLSIDRENEYESKQNMLISDYFSQEDDKITTLMAGLIG